MYSSHNSLGNSRSTSKTHRLERLWLYLFESKFLRSIHLNHFVRKNLDITCKLFASNYIWFDYLHSSTYCWLYYISLQCNKSYLSYFFQRIKRRQYLKQVHAQLLSYQQLHPTFKLMLSDNDLDIIRNILRYYL